MNPRELAFKAKARPDLLDLVLSNSADCIYVVDQDYHFAFLHSPRQFSRSSSANGKRCYESVMGRSVPCDFCPFSKAAGTQSLPTITSFDREGKKYELKISPLIGGEERPLYLHFLRDITAPVVNEPINSEPRQVRSPLMQFLSHISPLSIEAFVGDSPACLAVKQQIEAVVPFPTVTVLLEGETGTGKDKYGGEGLKPKSR
jgi:hypothetical protein